MQIYSISGSEELPLLASDRSDVLHLHILDVSISLWGGIRLPI